MKIAVILNETKGPLQQHLQLLAGQAPNYNQVRTTIMEYYRATTASNKLKQQTSSSVGTNLGGGAAPMDISAVKGKGYKAHKGKGTYKGKGKGKGKSYGGYKGKGKGNKGYNNGKGPIGQGNPFGYKGQQQNTGKGKGHKRKHAQDVCYRCGQPGHIAKNCRVPVYNYGEAPQQASEQYDVQQWYEDPYAYDGHWRNKSMGHHGQDTHHDAQQLALPAPQMVTSSDNAPPIQIVSGIQCQEPIVIAHIHDDNSGQQTTYQWSSYTCLPTMVRTRISNTTFISRQWTATTNSHQQ